MKLSPRESTIRRPLSTPTPILRNGPVDLMPLSPVLCHRPAKLQQTGMIVPKVGWAVALTVVLMLAANVAGAACSKAQVAGSDIAVPPERINQPLIAATILAEVNAARCKAGLRAVAGAPGLTNVAAAHSAWMAATHVLSHQSDRSGVATLAARLATAGKGGRGGTENIGQVHRYGVDLVGRFKITSATACQFATEDGQVIGAHSYRSLAAAIVALWLKSPAHKANMMNRKVRSLGSGVAFDGSADWCGQFYVTQTFSNQP